MSKVQHDECGNPGGPCMLDTRISSACCATYGTDAGAHLVSSGCKQPDCLCDIDSHGLKALQQALREKILSLGVILHLHTPSVARVVSCHTLLLLLFGCHACTQRMHGSSVARVHSACMAARLRVPAATLPCMMLRVACLLTAQIGTALVIAGRNKLRYHALVWGK